MKRRVGLRSLQAQSKPAGRFRPNKQVKFSRTKIRVIAAVVALVFAVTNNTWARAIEGTTPGGLVITNQAHASYSDGSGETYNTSSATVTITIAAVASVTVTPDETAPSDSVGPREQITRVFRVCNTGNTPDRVTLTQSGITAPAVINALYFDRDHSGTLTPSDELITLNQILSPQLAPGAFTERRGEHLGVLDRMRQHDPRRRVAFEVVLGEERGQDLGGLADRRARMEGRSALPGPAIHPVRVLLRTTLR